jgi:hypothetical protein
MRVNNDLHRTPYQLTGRDTKEKATQEVQQTKSTFEEQRSDNTNLILRQRAVVPVKELMLIRTFGR